METLKTITSNITSTVYWYIIGTLVVALIAQYLSLKTTHIALVETKLELSKLTSGVELQNYIIESQKANYEVSLIEASKKHKEISLRYQTIYTNIDNFGGDTNETDCQSSFRFLSTTKY